MKKSCNFNHEITSNSEASLCYGLYKLVRNQELESPADCSRTKKKMLSTLRSVLRTVSR